MSCIAPVWLHSCDICNCVFVSQTGILTGLRHASSARTNEPRGYIRIIAIIYGLYRDNGQEHGNYRDYMDY